MWYNEVLGKKYGLMKYNDYEIHVEMLTAGKKQQNTFFF